MNKTVINFEISKQILLNDFEIYREQTEEMLATLTSYMERLDSDQCSVEQFGEAKAYYDERPALRLH